MIPAYPCSGSTPFINALNYVQKKLFGAGNYHTFVVNYLRFKLPVLNFNRDVTTVIGNATSRDLTFSPKHDYSIDISTFYYMDFSFTVTDKSGNQKSYNEPGHSYPEGVTPGNDSKFYGSGGDVIHVYFPSATEVMQVVLKQYWWTDHPFQMRWFPTHAGRNIY